MDPDQPTQRYLNRVEKLARKLAQNPEVAGGDPIKLWSKIKYDLRDLSVDLYVGGDPTTDLRAAVVAATMAADYAQNSREITCATLTLARHLMLEIRPGKRIAADVHSKFALMGVVILLLGGPVNEHAVELALPFLNAADRCSQLDRTPVGRVPLDRKVLLAMYSLPIGIAPLAVAVLYALCECQDDSNLDMTLRSALRDLDGAADSDLKLAGKSIGESLREQAMFAFEHKIQGQGAGQVLDAAWRVHLRLGISSQEELASFVVAAYMMHTRGKTSIEDIVGYARRHNVPDDVLSGHELDTEGVEAPELVAFLADLKSSLLE